MKVPKSIQKLLCLGSVFLTLGTNVLAFNSQTHSYVTNSSLEILSGLSESLHKSGKINEREYELSKLMVNDYKDHIIEYSLKPDEDENQGAYKYHFYNPDTERNFAGEKETALKKCKTHFENAIKNCLEVTLLKNLGNYDSALDKEKEDLRKTGDLVFEEVGRSIHFLEDLSTCVHTGYDKPTDSVFKFPLHVKFEKKCDLISEECHAVIPEESLKYYEVNSLEDLAQNTAVLSLDNFYRLENIESEDYIDLAKNAVLNAQKRVVGLLYKFIKEAVRESTAYQELLER